MNALEKKIYYTMLLSIYKELLSPSQKEILTDYFEYDLSISEIAQNRNISRAAVDDAIQKGLSKLVDLEEKLQTLQKNEKICEKLAKLKQKSLNCGQINEIEDIERSIKNGIWIVNW